MCAANMLYSVESLKQDAQCFCNIAPFAHPPSPMSRAHQVLAKGASTAAVMLFELGSVPLLIDYIVKKQGRVMPACGALEHICIASQAQWSCPDLAKSVTPFDVCGVVHCRVVLRLRSITALCALSSPFVRLMKSHILTLWQWLRLARSACR